jgi:hypothetical protein
VLATFVAATVPVESAGDVNPLIDLAQKIGEDNPDSDDDSTMAASERVSQDENGVGSFERFMSTFGAPSRWAGRN